MKKILTLVFLLFAVFSIKAQEDSTWKPETHITGYVNTEAEYVDLSVWKDAKQNFAAGLSEAAFLVSYKPLKQLEFKGTFVYSHFTQDIQSLLVEGSATYTFNSMLKIGAGKYLTPLSPVNQYFYAPMNASVSLPMLVSHHVILPQSISGLQIAGEFGSELKVGYNVTYGNYLSIGHYPYGILGIQGQEDDALYMPNTVSPVAPAFQLGGSARVYANFNDIVNVGFNYFDGRHSSLVVNNIVNGALNPFSTNAIRQTYGIDMQLKFNNLKINGEYWLGTQKTTDLDEQIKYNYPGYYGEIIYEVGKFSPYLRYDYISDAKSTIYFPYPTGKLYSVESELTGYTAGIAFRPIYEILLKLEFRHLSNVMDYSNQNVPILTAMHIDPTNPLGITQNQYNYFGASIVFSF